MNPEQIAKLITEDPNIFNEGWEPGIGEEPNRMISIEFIRDVSGKYEGFYNNLLRVIIDIMIEDGVKELPLDEIEERFGTVTSDLLK
jgi:hypothetical protein